MKTQGETRLIYKYIKGKKIAYFNVNKEGEIAYYFYIKPKIDK